MTIPFIAQPLGNGTTLNVVNQFAHGATQVLLEKEAKDSPAQITISLIVDTSEPLYDPIVLSNTSCGLNAGEASCTYPLSSAQLNISAIPPTSCDEHCPWYWLWWRCRCHAAANLTVILPNATNLKIPIPTAKVAAAAAAASSATASSAVAPVAAPTPNALDLYVNVISVAVVSKGTSVRIAPVAGELLGQMLNHIDVTSTGGDISIEKVIALGGLGAYTDTGVVRLTGILGAGINATGDKMIVEDAVSAQACFYFFLEWEGGQYCPALKAPLEPKPANVTAPIALVMTPMNLTATGGLVQMNGTMGASDTNLVESGGGHLVLEGVQFLGSLSIDMRGGDGAASLVNLITLDCEVCKAPDLISTLSWGELPLSPKANLFCACDLANERGLRFNSTDAKLSAVLVIAHSIEAQSEGGALNFDELVLLPTAKSHNGTVGDDTPPRLTANSTYGAVAMNGLIAQKTTASSLVVDLASKGGDIKAIFSGGALEGSYDVSTSPGGIGHVGIVVDNTPTRSPTGMLGKGNASVTITHMDGNVALALSTKAPSVFAGISNGHGHGILPMEGVAQDGGQCAAEAAADDVSGSGEVISDGAALPEALEWMRPYAGVFQAMSDGVAQAQAEVEAILASSERRA